jgi:uncharacterized protein (TIGR00369 family)
MDIAEIERIIHAGVPLAAAWRIEVLAAAAGAATLRLPADPRLLRPGDTVSGPALMGLADVAMWAALLSLQGGRDNSVTSTMTVNFLRPAGPGPVLAEARVVKRGKRMLFGEILLRAETSADTAVHITTTWAVIGAAAGA